MIRFPQVARGGGDDFEDALRHGLDGYLSGWAACLACGHGWVAVAPSGVYELECPECKTLRGVFEALVIPEGEDLYLCRDCGCQHHVVARSGVVCVRCGRKTWFGEDGIGGACK